MTFHSPVWLYAIPAALLVLWFLFHLAARARKRELGKFAADRLLTGLLRSFSPARRRFKHLLIAAGIALVMLALARPEYGYTWRESPARGIDVLFVLDSSKSMLAQDIRPNRLERSKLAILDFVDKIPGDRVGLVAFAGNAFLQCPLTLDYDAFRLALEAVDTNVISHGGTDIARALTEAENAFSEDNNHKVVVLITDGEDLEESGVEQARLLASRGMTVYTVGVGTPEGELIPVETARGQIEYLRDSDGKPVTTRLDEQTLRDIAEATGGFYVPLGASGYGLEQVFESGLKSIPDQDLGSRRTKIGIERFQWPLGLALFLLAWEPLVGTRKLFLRRRLRKLSKGKQNAAAAMAALLGAACLLTPTNAHAQTSSPAPTGAPITTPASAPATPPEAPSDSADESSETEPSPPVVTLTPAQAAKLYRSGNYTAAAQAYAAAATANPADSEASYNLGNSLYAQGEYEAARQAYQQALTALDLELQADAFYNLGNASYQLGKAALADTPPAEDVRRANESAFAQTKQALDTGNDILKRAEPNRTPAALRSEETTQTMVPQQEIQQAIQQAEQAKQATTQAQEQSESTASAGENSATFWREAADEYKSSLELAPDSRDAAHNLDVVTRKLDRQAENNEAFSKEAKQLAENAEVLGMLIDELKKLLEQQQNDQNQQNDQQNQDQQNQDQNQQDDQQQSQDQQQQNDQNQQQQNQQNNQQSSSDSSQQQNQDQSQQNQQDSGQQDQQNSQNQNQQSGQQDQQQSGEQQQNQDNASDQQQKQQSGEQEQPDQQDSQKQDENSSGEDQSGQDQQKPEEEQQDKGEQPGEEDSQKQQESQQPQPGQSGQQQQPAGAEPQQDQGGPGEEGLSQEQLKELSEQVAKEQQAAAEAGGKEGEKKPAAAVGEGGEEAKDVPRVPGVMTREEARRLLDALKKDDKKLPSLYVPQQYNVDDEGKRKDW
ncbi:MAG: VWA domain-containing protein [Verrucomicrobiota bacterium JB024]|nr:VWA domain-containing protein [Verrucomicrobiota bacterium JB024]